jgi:hypothetical protein
MTVAWIVKGAATCDAHVQERGAASSSRYSLTSRPIGFALIQGLFALLRKAVFLAVFLFGRRG